MSKVNFKKMYLISENRLKSMNAMSLAKTNINYDKNILNPKKGTMKAKFQVIIKTLLSLGTKKSLLQQLKKIVSLVSVLKQNLKFVLERFIQGNIKLLKLEMTMKRVTAKIFPKLITTKKKDTNLWRKNRKFKIKRKK